jgi:hypothetical protein
MSTIHSAVTVGPATGSFPQLIDSIGV